MPRTNKKNSRSATQALRLFLLTRKQKTEPLLKVVPNIDGQEGNDSSTKLPKTKKSIFLKERCSWLGYPDSNQE